MLRCLLVLFALTGYGTMAPDTAAVDVPASLAVVDCSSQTATTTCQSPREFHVHENPAAFLMVFLEPIIGIAAFIGLLSLIAWRSGPTRPGREPEPLSHASAIYLARAIRMRAQVAIAIGIAAGVAGYFDESLLAIAFFGSPFFVALPIWGLVRWAQTTRALRLLHFDHATSALDGNRITVNVGRESAVLVAPTRLVDDAKRNALPRASL
jgi:hypothetical protein